MVDRGFEPGFELASEYIGMNFLVIRPDLVLIDDAQIHLIELLKFYGIESIPIPHELGRTCAGGAHCMTNDFYREEDIDFAKILSKPNDELTQVEAAGYFDPNLLEFLKSKGDISDWEEICNENNIFPFYLTEHLN